MFTERNLARVLQVDFHISAISPRNLVEARTTHKLKKVVKVSSSHYTFLDAFIDHGLERYGKSILNSMATYLKKGRSRLRIIWSNKHFVDWRNIGIANISPSHEIGNWTSGVKKEKEVNGSSFLLTAVDDKVKIHRDWLQELPTRQIQGIMKHPSLRQYMRIMENQSIANCPIRSRTQWQQMLQLLRLNKEACCQTHDFWHAWYGQDNPWLREIVDNNVIGNDATRPAYDPDRGINLNDSDLDDDSS